MDAGHADVVETLDRVPHGFGGDQGLLGYRNVGGAGGDDQNLLVGYERAFPLRVRHHDGARHFVEFRVGEGFSHTVENLPGGAGGQDLVPLCQPTNDLRGLLDAFVLAKHHLGKPLTQRPVVVQRRKAQVLVRKVLQLLQSVVHRQLLVAHRLQQLLDFFFVHYAPWSTPVRVWNPDRGGQARRSTHRS